MTIRAALFLSAILCGLGFSEASGLADSTPESQIQQTPRGKGKKSDSAPAPPVVYAKAAQLKRLQASAASPGGNRRFIDAAGLEEIHALIRKAEEFPPVPSRDSANSASGESAPQPDAGESEHDSVLQSEEGGGSYVRRVVRVSELFLALPYVLDALGEGPGAPDSDPLSRYDAADCMTFVETTLAIAESADPRQVEERLTAIRYDGGNAAFQNRHHFFTAQWVPAQTAANRIQDITEKIIQSKQTKPTEADADTSSSQISGRKNAKGKSSKSAPAAVRHTKTVTAEQWKHRTAGKHFNLPEECRPIGSYDFSYIPIGRIPEILDAVPTGAIFALVREDRPLTPFMVTHLGFVVRHSGKIWFRHAGRDLYGQIIDEECGHYITRAARYRKWPVLGMRFFLPKNPQAKK